MDIKENNNQENIYEKTESDNRAPVGGHEDTPQTSPKGHFGGVIGAVIIIAVLLGGLLYFWGKQPADVGVNEAQQATDESQQENVIPTDEKTKALQEQSDSDAILDIDADLNATDFEGLDSELELIEKELQQ